MNLKKSKQLKNQLLEQLKRTPIVEAACHKTGISRQTFYRWKAEDAEFAKEIDKAVADGQMLVNDLAESQLIGALKDRNFQAITYWLKHHHPNYKMKIQIEGSLQMPQEELTPEQEELVKEALRLASLSSAADTEQGEEGDGAASTINNNNQVKNHEQNTTKAKE